MNLQSELSCTAKCSRLWVPMVTPKLDRQEGWRPNPLRLPRGFHRQKSPLELLVQVLLGLRQKARLSPAGILRMRLAAPFFPLRHSQGRSSSPRIDKTMQHVRSPSPDCNAPCKAGSKKEPKPLPRGVKRRWVFGGKPAGLERFQVGRRPCVQIFVIKKI